VQLCCTLAQPTSRCYEGQLHQLQPALTPLCLQCHRPMRWLSGSGSLRSQCAAQHPGLLKVSGKTAEEECALILVPHMHLHQREGAHCKRLRLAGTQVREDRECTPCPERFHAPGAQLLPYVLGPSAAVHTGGMSKEHTPCKSKRAVSRQNCRRCRLCSHSKKHFFRHRSTGRTLVTQKGLPSHDGLMGIQGVRMSTGIHQVRRVGWDTSRRLDGLHLIVGLHRLCGLLQLGPGAVIGVLHSAGRQCRSEKLRNIMHLGLNLPQMSSSSKGANVQYSYMRRMHITLCRQQQL
jgi:hypothetical protein